MTYIGYRAEVESPIYHKFAFAMSFIPFQTLDSIYSISPEHCGVCQFHFEISYILTQRNFFSGILEANWLLRTMAFASGLFSSCLFSVSPIKDLRQTFVSAANFLTNLSRENKCSSKASGISSLMKSAKFKRYSTFEPDGPLLSRICLAISGKGAAPSQWRFSGTAIYRRAFFLSSGRLDDDVERKMSGLGWKLTM